MAKQPNPACKFCGGTGFVPLSQLFDGQGFPGDVRWLPCVCTNAAPDELPEGRERIV